MPAQWTAEIIGLLHLYGISRKHLAEYLDCTPEYVTMVLNGKRSPKGAEEKFKKALLEIKKQKGS